MEYNDIYDKDRNLTGRTHLRGTPWKPGEYGLVVCVWVHDGEGNLLMTKRAKEKSFAGTWENSGGAARAGEDSRTAIARELSEETGIQAGPEEFEYLCSDSDKCTHFDFYCLKRKISTRQVVLQPQETDAVQWVSFDKIHEMIENKQICHVIAHQFLRQEAMLRARQTTQV